MRPDIKAAFVSHTLTAGRAVKRLEQHLMPGEPVTVAAVGNHGGGPGVIAVTDRRVLLVSNIPGRESTVDIPLDQVSSVSATGGMGSGGLVITASGRREEVSAIRGKAASKVSDAIRSSLG